MPSQQDQNSLLQKQNEVTLQSCDWCKSIQTHNDFLLFLLTHIFIKKNRRNSLEFSISSNNNPKIHPQNHPQKWKHSPNTYRGLCGVSYKSIVYVRLELKILQGIPYSKVHTHKKRANLPKKILGGEEWKINGLAYSWAISFPIIRNVVGRFRLRRFWGSPSETSPLP